MSIRLVAAASAVVLLLASPQVSMAKSIENLLTVQQVTDFCTANGLGEKTAQFTMPDGTAITGTIDCEPENIAGAASTDESVSSQEGEDDQSSSSPEDDTNEGLAGGDNAGSGGDGNGDGDGGSDGGRSGGDSGADD